MKRIGITWPVGDQDSAGGHALNLALQMARKGLRPTLLSPPQALEADPLHRRLLAPAIEEHAATRTSVTRNRGRCLPFPVLHHLGDRLTFPASAEDMPGSPNIGVAEFEQTDIAAEAIRRAADWPLIATASSWSTRVLRDRGLSNVLTCPQGIDPALFHPAPRPGLLPGRFVVFSGGGPGHRCGHDILAAAFRAFHQRHPEALLVCAWDNPPADLPPDAVLFLGPLSSGQRAGILRDCDLAVFPSRCEGSTNPAAMEAMACGLPTILAGNTGHLDLLGDHVYVLRHQGVVIGPNGASGHEGWGECALEEVLETLERVHRRRGEATEKGQAAARFMRKWTWEAQTSRLLAAVDRAVAGTAVPPPSVEEDYGWGLNLHRAARLAEAERVYDHVLDRAPDHMAARGDRGNVRRDQGDIAGAVADFQAILAARPDHPRALHSLGNILRRSDRLTEAAACLRRAAASTDRPSVHWDLAFTLLLMGRYAEAWPHFERRHAALGLRTPGPAKPRWDGQPVTDGTLLVLDEQGLGDTLQFLRFLPRIPVGDGGRVVFAGKPATLPVARRFLAADAVFNWDGSLPRSQAWVPLMSLPERFGVTRPEDVPPPSPFSLTDHERVARWRPVVRGADDRPVVGLCWRGNPDFSGDALRSPGLAALRPILDVDGLRFVSLQVGPGRREITELTLTDRLSDVGGAVEAAGAGILDTLAVLESCDFVVSSCTSVVHMAGLTGRPGRVLLSHRPDWRWMTDRTDTPWYPSLRLIRQPTLGDWASVARQAAKDLAQWRDR